MLSTFQSRYLVGTVILSASHYACAYGNLKADIYSGLSDFSISVVDLTPEDGIAAGYTFGSTQHRGGKVKVVQFFGRHVGVVDRDRDFESLSASIGPSSASIVGGPTFQQLPSSISGQTNMPQALGREHWTGYSLARIVGANITVFENTKLVFSAMSTTSADYDFDNDSMRWGKTNLTTGGNVALGIGGSLYDSMGNHVGYDGDAASFRTMVSMDGACTPTDPYSVCADIHQYDERRLEVSIETGAGQIFKGGFNAEASTGFVTSIPEPGTVSTLALGLVCALWAARRRTNSNAL